MNLLSFSNLDPDIYRMLATVMLLALAAQFCLVVLKKILDYQLKKQLIEKGKSETFSNSLLKTESNNEQTKNIKWFAIFLSTGIGLFLVESFLPLGIHSIGIMAISIAMGFLAYFFYLKKVEE
ncbi:MAG: hypothetical protein AB8G15_02960 [Saprospiraceae bacterium]